ncbi:uncharacterized protein LOC142776934 [Rhipicephalus microplus]|uniref:uncharacterized protein LOC142776934 n=1 Tax=Rhipicephalus microplus TaxID=6941 RepID=UPI003F6D0304
MDVMHPSYVAADKFTGEVTWIKQVLEGHSVCLPMTSVTISGPFGELVTRAAVSKMVPLEYPYLLSNRSDQLLRERGQKFRVGRVQALARFKTHQGSLSAEQKKEPRLGLLHGTAKEGITRRNGTMHEKGGLMYRHYKDRKCKILDQLVASEKYHKNILCLCHGNGWSGHLGVNKTKERLLLEYYWPGCFKDVELLVRSWDACQRIGKPGLTCSEDLVKTVLVGGIDFLSWAGPV